MSFSIPYYTLVRQSLGGRVHKILGVLSCKMLFYLRLSVLLHMMLSTRITLLQNALQ